MTTPADGAPQARWPLSRQLPLLTTLIVVVMMALTLTLTYQAMVQSRAEAMHARLLTLMSTLRDQAIIATDQRKKALEKYSQSPALYTALSEFAQHPVEQRDSALVASLEAFRAATDTNLAIELLTPDGQRVAHAGNYQPGDTLSTFAPELRSPKSSPVSRVPNERQKIDSIAFGALYTVNGRVYAWTLVPLKADSHVKGYVAVQRRMVYNQNTQKLLNGLVGSTSSVFVRNRNDNFWASIDARPASPPTRRDTTESGFIEYRPGVPVQMGIEARAGSTPYYYTIEVPRNDILAEPRSTLRSILALSLVILLGGAATVWALARRVTLPLGELTVAAEAMAKGDYRRRVELSDAMSDEVARLGTSFNRMATQVDVSQRELASQVDQAITVSEELEQANDRLKEITVDAEQARDAAVKANQAKSDFLAVMSHELRTPLNAIGGYADILKLGIYGELNEQQNDAMTRIARSQQTLLALINDVLNFAKLEAGRVNYSITSVPVAPALAALEDLVGPQLRDKKMKYVVQTCSPELAVHADSEKLQQILINLLSNAIKYTGEGGHIEVHCDVDATKVHISVTDSGIGIAADRMDRIFDPFIQVGRALNRPHEGVGLGLSISRDLARGMGGSLSVKSKPDEGSTFTLTLSKA